MGSGVLPRRPPRHEAMTPAVQSLLASFDALPESERREAAGAILLRLVPNGGRPRSPSRARFLLETCCFASGLLLVHYFAIDTVGWHRPAWALTVGLLFILVGYKGVLRR